jgi:hypothetical protein
MIPEKRIYPMLFRTLAFGVALVLVSPASAANLPPAPTMPAFGSTASQLYHVCAEATHDSDLICQSFLAGMWEASRIISLGQHMSGDNQPSLCTPSVIPIPVRELVAIYNRWAEGHPNNLEAAAGAAAAMLAFGDAFPCSLPSASR